MPLLISNIYKKECLHILKLNLIRVGELETPSLLGKMSPQRHWEFTDCTVLLSNADVKKQLRDFSYKIYIVGNLFSRTVYS